ncbi:MAG: hypothetical protein ACI4OA_04740 [Selenomonadaceae bacterium]
MCKAIEDLVVAERAESEAKGRIEGRAEGRAEGKKETSIENIKKIMESLNTDVYRAMDILQIPADERAIYLPLVSN